MMMTTALTTAAITLAVTSNNNIMAIMAMRITAPAARNDKEPPASQYNANQSQVN